MKLDHMKNSLKLITHNSVFYCYYCLLIHTLSDLFYICLCPVAIVACLFVVLCVHDRHRQLHVRFTRISCETSHHNPLRGWVLASALCRGDDSPLLPLLRIPGGLGYLICLFTSSLGLSSVSNRVEVSVAAGYSILCWAQPYCY